MTSWKSVKYKKSNSARKNVTMLELPLRSFLGDAGQLTILNTAVDDAKRQEFDDDMATECESSSHCDESGEVITNAAAEQYSENPTAPVLSSHYYYHVLILSHPNYREWTHSLSARLESPSMGFRCCRLNRDLPSRLPLLVAIKLGIEMCQTTILLLTENFVTEFMQEIDLAAILTASGVDEDDGRRGDNAGVIILRLDDYENVPSALRKYPAVNLWDDDWWSTLLDLLKSKGNCDGKGSKMSTCFGQRNFGIRNGQLLLSVKSFCSGCGKEIVDAQVILEHLETLGFHLADEELRSTFSHVLSGMRFSCHLCCYNVTSSVIFFTSLLILCLTVVPVIETHLLFGGRRTGLELVHGCLVWLCLLTLYLVFMHITKRQLKLSTDERLKTLNSTLFRHNLLAGVEDLGINYFNKYLFHFVYFEIGPCLDHLQELLNRLDNCSLNNKLAVERSSDDESREATSSSLYALQDGAFTNLIIQSEAEKLILKKSGEYIRLLVARRLGEPRTVRHLTYALCPCQFIEQIIYGMIV